MTDKGKQSERLVRPDRKEIETIWDELFTSRVVSIAQMRQDALGKTGLGTPGIDGGVTLRSVHWRLFHNVLPEPTSLSSYPTYLSSSRGTYDTLRRKHLVAPDGRYASDCTSPLASSVGVGSSSSSSSYPSSPHLSAAPLAGPSSSSSAARSAASTVLDPLSLNEENPWKTWFAHVDLRGTIRQDVERTFPDIEYFEDEGVRRIMTTSLFLWAVENPDVGYRQGMHELFAVCLLVIDRDSLDPPASAPDDDPLLPQVESSQSASRRAMKAVLDRRYIEHDAYDLYNAIMKTGKSWYEWRQEEGPRGSKAKSATRAPIIDRCDRLHSSLLQRIDPQLWESLETQNVEAQLWAIRWIRLILTRELPFSIALQLWDGIFADDSTMALLDWVVIVMILLIRNELIDSEHHILLTRLLRYPAPSTEYPFQPAIIIAQARFLRDNINPAAGVQIVMENQDKLGIPAQPPEKTQDVSPRLAQGPGRAVHAALGNGRPSPLQSPRTAGVQGLAAGLFERAQAAGLDKTVLSAMAEMRKNLPDASAAYSYLPNLPFSPGYNSRETSGSFSTIPSSASVLPSRNAQLPPHLFSPNTFGQSPSTDSFASTRTIKDADRELAELRLAMMGMGKAMSTFLAVLGQHEIPKASPGQAEAWRGLEKVKDSLLAGGEKDVEELVREWGWHEGLESSGVVRHEVRAKEELTVDDRRQRRPKPWEL